MKEKSLAPMLFYAISLHCPTCHYSMLCMFAHGLYSILDLLNKHILSYDWQNL